MKRPTPKAPADGESVTEVPAIFATIHFQSADRPEGYSDEEIRELNTIANTPKPRSLE